MDAFDDPDDRDDRDELELDDDLDDEPDELADADDLDGLADLLALLDLQDHPDPGDPRPAGGVVRLAGPDDLLGILPWRLGFVPEESLVLTVLQGPRRRERVVMRLDLPDADDEPAVADEAAARAAAVGADAVFVVVYTEATDDAGELPRSDLVDDLAAALDDVDVELVDAVLVRGDRRWSYLCPDPACCPPEGVALPLTPSPAIDAYAAEAVVRGTVVLPTRSALRARVEPGAAAADGRVHGAAAAAVARLAADGDDPERRGRALLETLRGRFAAGDRRPPSPLEARLVAVALASPAVRDPLLTAVLDDDEEAVRDLLGHVARLVPDDVAGPVCSVHAWLSYAVGDGALATMALERAVRADPTASFPQVLLDGIDRMLPPEGIRRLCRQVRAAVRPV